MALPEYARADGRPAIFLEITDRDDLGENLHAPQADEAGGGRYRLIQEVQRGDTVLHYHRPAGGIVGISRAESSAVSAPITWAAKGSSARSRSVEPYKRPGWLVRLMGYTPLDPMVPQEEVRLRSDAVLGLRSRLEAEYGTGLHYPYVRYGAGLRTFQAYMALVPRQMLSLLPGLAAQVDGFESLEQLPGPPPSDPPDPDLFLANEDVKFGGTGEVFIDPEAMTRASQEHNRLQNDLRKKVLASGLQLEKEAKKLAAVDLAWRDGKGRLTIAEVKSLTATNEAHQLRYGVGQVLDYWEEFMAEGEDARCVLFVSRSPQRISWVNKCQEASIELAWPGRWPSL